MTLFFAKKFFVTIDIMSIVIVYMYLVLFIVFFVIANDLFFLLSLISLFHFPSEIRASPHCA